MIYNTTHTNLDYNEMANGLLGRSFPILTRLKMGGIGSQRMIIAELGSKLQPEQIQFSELTYGNIELRPVGIIVHFTNRQLRFSWCVPYYKMHIYNSTFFSIHAEGTYIKFRKNKQYAENKKFIDKMIDLKNKHLNLNYYDG